MLLAELEVFHTRPAVPTRRVALGHLVLPVDPAPGFGGLLLGVLLAAVFRQLVAIGARRRAATVRSNAEAAVTQVARELVIDPVDRELAVRSRLRELLTAAAAGRP